MTQRQLRWRKLVQCVSWVICPDRTTKPTAPQGIAQSFNGRCSPTDRRSSRLVSLLMMGGVIFISPLTAIVQGTGVANAQLRPIADDTLGNERSLVSPDQVINGLPSNAIDGGARRGANLFHSFREFNIDIGRGVYFTNPAGVANILTRVTGGNPSQILGTLGVLGTANLFLINPNGILFGANAQLDVGGSLIASTANSVVFSNGFAFSATNPQAPPLLTVNAPIGLQHGNNPGAIQVQGAGLQVPDGQTLTLAGGAVNVDGGQLIAPGGRVELAGLGSAGEVGLTQQGQEWRLNVPDGLSRADVSLTNGALVDVSAGGSGEIAIAARNLELSAGSRLQAGIGEGLGSAQAQAGKITIQAAENVTLQGSVIENLIAAGAIGKGGDVVIDARSLFLTNSIVSANTFSEGAGGNLTVKATESIQLVGTSADAQFGSGLLAITVNRGNVGNISIDTGNLIVRDGAQVLSGTFGEGAGGNLTVKATDSIQLIGESADRQFASGLVSSTNSNGNAGNISIDTGNLIVRDGAQVSSGTLRDGGAVSPRTSNEGAGGNLTVKATDSVQLIGKTANRRFASGLFASSNSRSNAGNISIETENLIMRDEAQLSTNAYSRGNSGNISIETRNLIARDGAQVSTSTFGEGAGGNLTVKAADSIQLIGRLADDTGGSGFYADAQPGSRGDARNLIIETRNLILRDGGRVVSGTLGEGAGGNLTVKATDSIQLIGRGATGRFSSGLLSRANFPVDAVGNERIGAAGNTSIETRNLIIRNGAEVRTGTRGAGAGGKLTVKATDSIQVSGTWGDGQFSSRLTAQTESSGNAGDMTLKTGQFIIEDGGEISSQQTTGTATGNVGNIRIEAELLSVRNNARITVEDRSTIVDRPRTKTAGSINIQTNVLKVDRGLISAATASTDGGNIGLDVRDVLLLRNGGLISTNAGTAQAGGNGGNITFNGKFIVAVPNENSDISANAFTGSGGRVNINAQGLFGMQFQPQLTPLSDITASSDFGIAGVVAIDTPDVDPSRGLVQLPVDLTDASRLIVQTCPTGDSLAKQPNEFIITGRGGLPPTPSEAVNRDAIQVDLVTADAGDQQSVSKNEPAQNRPPFPSESPIVEAQGWQVAANGTVFLLAATPTKTIAPLLNRLMHCR